MKLLDKLEGAANKVYRPNDPWHGPGCEGPTCDDWENNYIALLKPKTVLALCKVVRAANKFANTELMGARILRTDHLDDLKKALTELEEKYDSD